VDAVIVVVVAPVLHRYVDPPLAVKLVEAPGQMLFVPATAAVGFALTVQEYSVQLLVLQASAQPPAALTLILLTVPVDVKVGIVVEVADHVDPLFVEKAYSNPQERPAFVP
jgi:hypothetical protein